MATITIGLSGSGVVNGTRTYTLNDATVTRLINAMKYYFGEGTNTQTLAAWADDLIAETKIKVHQAERNSATAADVVIS
jgi:hypothetical protein